MTQEQFQSFVVNKLDSIRNDITDLKVSVAKLEERKNIIDGAKGWLAVIIAAIAVLLRFIKF